MIEITEKAVIARSPETVWAAVADFGEISRWAPNVDHSCLTSAQSEGAGSVRRVQVDRNALLERVTEWEPGRQLCYSIEGLPPVVRSVTNTWKLDGTDGGTAVTITSRIDTGPRPPQQVVARVFGRVLAKASRRMLEGLKTHLEEDTR